MEKSKLEIKLHYSSTSDETKYKLLVNGIVRLYIYKEPTGDCQSYSIANIASLLSHFPTDWQNILVEIQKVINKNCLLINMRTDNHYFNDVVNFFKEDIIINSPYKSTRDSSMALLLINTKKLRNIITDRNLETAIPF